MKIVKLVTDAQKTTRTTVDTIEVTESLIRTWKNPPFQRPMKVNEKVRALATWIRDNDGVIPGVITLGVIGRDVYKLDGQHRCEAYVLSGCPIGYVDVRIHHFDEMAEMGLEFVNLNSHLVGLRPDDILRGLEGMSEALTKIRRRCPYVGYDFIRRSDKAPVLSMSVLLRSWAGSATEVPKSGGVSSAHLAREITEEDANTLIGFLDTAMGAWGRDAAYARLWSVLNLTLCMWLYRRLVVTPYSAKTVKLTREQFGRGLMSLSASDTYLDWLVGRSLSERDRAPAYARIKAVMSPRIEQDVGKRVMFPAPAWTHGKKL